MTALDSSDRYALDDALSHADPRGLDVIIVVGNRAVSATGNSVEGTITVYSTKTGQSFVGHTLENIQETETKPDGSELLQPPIPAGAYKGTKRQTSASGETYTPRRVEILGILGYHGIELHPGNTPGAFKGCLGPGTTRATDRIWESIPAMESINSIIDGDGGAINVFIGPVMQAYSSR